MARTPPGDDGSTSSDPAAELAAADAHTRGLTEADREDPAAWFERLYANASRGVGVVPWDRHEPSVLLSAWAYPARHPGQGGRRVR